MAQAALRTASLKELEQHFRNVVQTLGDTKPPSKLFPNGIELLELTLKAGNNIEFSVVISGTAKKPGGTAIGDTR